MTTTVRTPRTRPLTIVAQDPAVKVNNRILTAQVMVPAESLARGPRGTRVHVVDYDASTGALYEPFEYPHADGSFSDPFKRPNKRTILEDPRFHAQNVYAIVMRILGRFEFALGRRVSWGIPGHQLKIAPHAIADANAFYSRDDECLAFGYFPGSNGGTVFTCLSHDVIAHETCHALVDGLRKHFMAPSSPDQAAFHEGFSDIVALLSVFAMPEVVTALLDRPAGDKDGLQAENGLIDKRSVSMEALRTSVLLGLAEQMGQEMASVRGDALRQSVQLTPSVRYLKESRYMEPHLRGEILVAAVMNAFLRVLNQRLKGLGGKKDRFLNRDRVAEEAADCADYLLTMAVRALDYCPPIHIDFPDFLSALLTADHEIRPDDSRYSYRSHLRQSFADYGIEPGAKLADGTPTPDGQWTRFDDADFNYDCVHFESLTRDVDEMARLVWEHRDRLHLFDRAFTEVVSVRPCHRIAPDDGFPLRETVAECRQHVTVRASELKSKFDIEPPVGMPPNQVLALQGGTTLILDEFGRVKFAVYNSILTSAQQSRHLDYLWKYGYFEKGASLRQQFSRTHLRRSLGEVRDIEERW